MHIKRVVGNSEIGAAIKRRRLELSLSQEELAGMLKLSNQQVQRYESGKDRLNVEKLQALSLALMVPPTFFLGHTGSVEAILETDCERELISHYRKIYDAESKMIVVNLARKFSSVLVE